MGSWDTSALWEGQGGTSKGGHTIRRTKCLEEGVINPVNAADGTSEMKGEN